MRIQESPRAERAGFLVALYAVEADIRSQAADERQRIRQERSGPIIGALQPWFKAHLEHISRKGKLAEAWRTAQFGRA